MQQDAACPLTPRTMIDQLESRDIRDKIRIPRAVALDHSAFTAEKSLFAAEAIGKREWIVEDKMEITKPVDQHRRVGKRDEPCRLIPLNVEMLTPGVKLRQEHAALLPFERLLPAVFRPNARRAAPFDDVDQLFEEIALRQGLPLRRDFTHVAVAAASRAEHIDTRPESSLPFPRAHGNRGQII